MVDGLPDFESAINPPNCHLTTLTSVDTATPFDDEHDWNITTTRQETSDAKRIRFIFAVCVLICPTLDVF
jgi:hypothetical protein